MVWEDYQKQGIGSKITNMIIEFVDAEKGKELFYEKIGFKLIPHEFCGSGMRKVIHK